MRFHGLGVGHEIKEVKKSWCQSTRLLNSKDKEILRLFMHLLSLFTSSEIAQHGSDAANYA
jgi:hypothetical protein